MSVPPSIPPALDERLQAIDKEVTLLHFQWTYLMQLFGKRKHVAVINATAPAIFGSIQASMLTDIILRLMRLIDPPKSMGQANLSLRSFAAEIPDAALRAKFEDLEKQVRDKAQDVKLWRDKKLTHNDLLHHLKQIAPLPLIEFSNLTSALALIREAMNLIHGHYFDRDFRYEMCITEKDGNALAFYLNYGLVCWNEDKEKRDLTRFREWQHRPEPPPIA